MLVIKLKKCRQFVSADGCLLRELIHPAKLPVKLRYSLAHAIVKPGITTRPHKLRTSELYYILEGRGVMRINSETKAVGPGCAVYIPPGAVQCIKNAGKTKKLVFVCIVDPAWRKKDEKVF